LQVLSSFRVRGISGALLSVEDPVAPKLTVFDPALCCPTGVCGAVVDPALARFVADVEQLRARGGQVRRFNLAQEPDAFASNQVVRAALASKGTTCLPLVLVDGAIVSEGSYPDRTRLFELAGLPVGRPLPTFAQATPSSTTGCCEPAPGASAGADGRSSCCDN
jgi:arsenite-transporting ATPase